MDPALRGRIVGTGGRAILALPRAVQERLGGPAPPGAPELEPEARLLARVVTRVESEPEAAQDAATPQARAEFDARAAAVGGRVRAPVRSEDRVVAGADGPLPARLYVPDGLTQPSGLLVFFHGGGWVRGSVESHDNACRLLAHLARLRVLSVEYRLAPEHPFPAPVHDALAAWLDAVAHAGELGADPARMGVGGDSAGGNLAAAVALAARDGDHARPAFQVLVYPACDLSRKHPSVHEFSSGFLLGEADIDRYKELYVPDAERWAEPLVSPLRAADLRGLPPAHVATAAADPLRDEGEAYAAALADAGVTVSTARHPHVHGFLNMTSARAARRAIGAIASAAASAGGSSDRG